MTATSSPEALKDLRITRFIVHIVDHKTQTLALSGLETPVGASSGFPHPFFQHYILQALASPLRRRACFLPSGGVVSSAFSALMASPQSFVDTSQLIASRLYDVMRQSSYSALIKPGDLMLALCQDAAKADGPAYLAILKLDPSDAVMRRVVQVGDKQQVIFETRDGRVPEAEENKIQKIAVIGQRVPEPEPFDLILLDNNINEVKVARFFYGDFLQCSLNRDPGEVTQFLFREVKRLVSRSPNVVTPSLAPDERRSIVDTAAARLVRGGPVVLDDFARQVSQVPGRSAPQVEAMRAALVERLSRGRPEERISPSETVSVDRAAAEAQSKIITYVLDGGIQIRGDAAQIKQRVTISPRDAAGNVTITIVTGSFEVR
jgi:hypothetical protein